MSSKNGIVAGSIILVTLAIGGVFYYTSQKPKTDAEKHLEQVNQRPNQNVVFDVKNPNFATFGGSTKRHKKGNRNTKKHRKH